jgi:hypothetical protein
VFLAVILSEAPQLRPCERAIWVINALGILDQTLGQNYFLGFPPENRMSTPPPQPNFP